MTLYPSYGEIFRPHSEKDVLGAGKRHTEDALKVLEGRWEGARTLRTLPIENAASLALTQTCMEFLKTHAKGPFESDNIKHVARLISNIKLYRAELRSFLGVADTDVQLLAALHDLGKSLVPVHMGKFLESIFGKEDFVNLRVLPHELYSMFWIRELTSDARLTPSVSHLLMDQIANHNFGPDLNRPLNLSLLDKKADGTYKHWWLGNWQTWADKMNSAGVKVNALYGGTISPLATSLVLFDRVDGGHPHSWEKFLNQDSLSGRVNFSFESIGTILSDAHETAMEQVFAVGRQIKEFFVEDKKNVSINEFRPYVDALEMLDKSRACVLRLRESNRLDRLSYFKITDKNSILYQDQTAGWIRIDSQVGKAVKYKWDQSKWNEIQTSERPIAILLETIYHDWDLTAK